MRPARWSLAKELLALQMLLLLAVFLTACVVVVLQTRKHAQEERRHEVLVLADSVASNPLIAEQAGTADPSARLQPYAEQVRKQTGVDFIVIMGPNRTRWTHPDPTLLGLPFIGTVAPALAGRSFTETHTGTLGPSVRAVAPVRDAAGRVVALVAVGITTEAIREQLVRQLPVLIGTLGLLLAIAVAGAWQVSRRLRRQTHGLGPIEITRMYEYHDAVLHSVREGLIVVDRQRRVGLINDEACRLLNLHSEVVGLKVADLALADSLKHVLTSGEAVLDELHLTGARVVVVNQSPAIWEGRSLGSVATLRDRTELEALAEELDSTRALAESLRSQAHESANRTHAIVVLIETGQYEAAVEFATADLEHAQRLTDRVVSAVEEPVLAALLLGKTAQASERGVEIAISDDTTVPAMCLPARDLVTVVGNLVDNAIDAAMDGPPPRRVTVSLRPDGDVLVIRVADTGAGLDPALVETAFTRGWSTKQSVGRAGRGLGLPLVGQVLRRYAGTIEVQQDSTASGFGGAVFIARLPLNTHSSDTHSSDTHSLETHSLEKA
jgi:sensor histidine kinase regulating citrate/malate metabolism